jgi:hypothetical protein
MHASWRQVGILVNLVQVDPVLQIWVGLRNQELWKFQFLLFQVDFFEWECRKPRATLPNFSDPFGNIQRFTATNFSSSCSSFYFLFFFFFLFFFCSFSLFFSRVLTSLCPVPIETILVDNFLYFQFATQGSENYIYFDLKWPRGPRG